MLSSLIGDISTSTLLDFNSALGVSDPAYGQGRFKQVFTNTNDVHQSIEVCPHRISIPHVFPVIGVYNNIFGVVNALDSTDYNELFFLGSKNIHNTTDLCSELSHILTTHSNLNHQISLVSEGELTMRIDGASPYALVGNADFFRLLGLSAYVYAFPAPPKTWNGVMGVHEFPKEYGDLYLFPLGQPTKTLCNLNTIPYVNVAMTNIAPGNLICADNYERDVLTAVPLDVPFGTYKVFVPTAWEVESRRFERTVNIQSVEVFLLDPHYRPLHVPLDFHVHCMLKVLYTP